ncbi:MAG: hypothetical protein H8E86_04550 [Planctomycetes bacterium]|nr:hypothetical protein [Planctomycetota bacterium]
MRLIFVFFFIAVGCSQRSSAPPTNTDISPNQVRKLQSQRTEKFEELVGRGVIEFRWSDDDGNHMEQGALDFWKQGDAVSLRISKLGELILWFGGDQDQYWLFDLLGDETVLTVNGEGAMFSDIKMALVMLGLAPLPEGLLTVSDGVVKLVDVDNRIWTIFYEPATNRPLSIEVIDGDAVSQATHRRSIAVEVEGLHALHWPITGGLIDVTDSRGNTEIKIGFETLSTVVSEERFDRVMSLAFLQKALRPISIHYGKEHD